MTLRCIVSALLAWTLIGCTEAPSPVRNPPRDAHAPAATVPPTPAPTSTQPHGHTAAGLAYIEALTGGAHAEDTLPMVVVLHGYGDSPEGILGLYTPLAVPARVIALRGPMSVGPGFAWFAPGGDRAAGIRASADAVTLAMAALTQARPTCGLPVVSGFSQGGMIAYALAVRSPSVVRAAAPLSGMLPESLRPLPRALGGLLPEVQGFHGEADQRVPVDEARRTMVWLREAGLTANLTTEPTVGHAVSPSMQTALLTFLARTARCVGR